MKHSTSKFTLLVCSLALFALLSWSTPASAGAPVMVTLDDFSTYADTTAMEANWDLAGPGGVPVAGTIALDTLMSQDSNGNSLQLDYNFNSSPLPQILTYTLPSNNDWQSFSVFQFSYQNAVGNPVQTIALRVYNGGVLTYGEDRPGETQVNPGAWNQWLVDISSFMAGSDNIDRVEIQVISLTFPGMTGSVHFDTFQLGPAICGDSIINGIEVCDDGVNDGGEGECIPGCTALQICGDATTNGTEECDDANINNNDACLSTCLNASCGDGWIWTGNEECDDANPDAGDGCSDLCEEEFGSLCTGEPSTCVDDSDGDDESDADECPTGIENCPDTDGDGIPDHLDADDQGPGPGDSDNDGLTDDIECFTGSPCPDSDGDGIPDHLDADTLGGLPIGIADKWCAFSPGPSSPGAAGWLLLILGFCLVRRRS